jgi:hypothetical protein
MNFQRHVKGRYSWSGVTGLCSGTISARPGTTKKTIYASWNMYDESKAFLGSRARTYFIDKDDIQEADIIPLILNNISNFRIERERIFSDIEINNNAEGENQ